MTNLVFALAVTAGLLTAGCKVKEKDNGEVSDLASTSSQNPLCRKAETWDSKRCGNDQSLCTEKSQVRCELVNERNTLRIKPIVSR
jgi:hypothetical protein